MLMSMTSRVVWGVLQGSRRRAAMTSAVPRNRREMVGGMHAATRFCTAPDGLRLAYAIEGRGTPLIKACNWLTHLEYDRRSPVWRHWISELSRGHTLVRYDERGCGLSDREFEGVPTVETFVGDLTAVVDAAGFDRFALLGLSGGGP